MTNPVLEAMMSRRSVRRFTDEPVSREVLDRILTAASYAPSGHNMQPWQVHVVTGAAKDRISAAVIQHITEGGAADEEFDYYPVEWHEPYQGRRRAVGFTLYDLLGIKREDKARRHEQMLENFKFFGAPVGMFISFDRRLATGQFLDIGMFIQSILVAARAEGIHSCGQVAWTPYHQVLRPLLGMPDEQMLACGISLGHEDVAAPENKLRVEKVSPAEWTTWHEA